VDGRARAAFEQAVRATISHDLDELSNELTTLRRQVTTLQQLAGLPAAPGRDQRRQHAAEMRAQGHSTRAIAAILGANRGTISSDLRLLGVEPPAGRVVGLDGRVTAPRLRPPG
jgi:DNA-binding CsgD family transcriptional regulator